MTPLLFLMGLLLLAYIGSFLVGDRRLHGFGLPSGIEYVVLGFLLGPSVFDLVDRPTLESFDPIAHVALGWIALALGLGFGVDGTRATRPGRLLGGALVSLFTAAAVGIPLWFGLSRWGHFDPLSRALLAGGAALASAETTRESVRWVTERYGAVGPISSLVSDLARSDDLIPLLGVAALFAWNLPPTLPWHFHPVAWASITVGVGIVLGATAALLIGRDLRTNEAWGTLLGLSVLGAGLTTRLGLATISAMFAMGVATALLSGHRRALLAMVEPTERTILHPVLLLAGARVDVHATPGLLFIVLAAVAARALAKGIIGLLWQGASRTARKAGPMLGAGLLSSGTLSMTLGLAVALRFPGELGDAVLAIAAGATLFGEFVGPFALRASLDAAGELPAGPSSMTPAPPRTTEEQGEPA